MPEAVEVLSYYRFITGLIGGNNSILYNFRILSGKYANNSSSISNYQKVVDLLPLRIVGVVVKGKTIFIELENEISFVITHGMTGCWSQELEKHTRFEFEIQKDDEKSVLYYVDARNFGTLNIVTSKEELNKAKDKLGPYILDENLSYDKFYSRLDKKKRTKLAIGLLDQNLISGIGNYLRCDIIWYAKVDGEKLIGELSEEEKMRIYDSAINVTRYHGGMTNNIKINLSEYEREYFIYSQESDIYGNEVYTKTLNNRTYHYTKVKSKK